ncbi:MAG: HAMP domain-containing histidine kinase [Anaerolineae bacterium]|nr:HAMP domain-containing histidine kinase [Anaerolineae bacterium]
MTAIFPDIHHLVLDESQTSFAITDQQFNIIQIGGRAGVFDKSIGQSILTRIPELIGNEAVLSDILTGALPRFQLERINRPTLAGSPQYLSIIVLPCRCDIQEALLVIVTDNSEQGLFVQLLAQQRNELRLLRRKLETQAQELARANHDLSGQIDERVQAECALRENEATLRQYAAELEAQNAELTAFAHTVAHDIKGPLSALLGYSYWLDADSAHINKQETQEGLKYIHQSAQRMRNIVDELLLLASVREIAEIDIRPLNTSSLVRETLERLQYMIDAQQAQVIVPERWPFALGYGPWVEEIWVNYISNAIKYGGQPPQVELGYDLPTADSADTTIRFWVRDNGAGLSPQEQCRLFTPFERLHQVRAEGHGLGLSIVRRIAEKLSGQVGVESQVGQGSTFYFTLPADQH